MSDQLAPVVLPTRKDPALRVLPMPSDANYSGDISGGWIMSQVDVAGSIPVARPARGRIVTIAVNSFLFRQPVTIRDLVSFYAEVARVGNTSITVDVEVYAHGDHYVRSLKRPRPVAAQHGTESA